MLQVWIALIENMTVGHVLMNISKVASLNLLDGSCAASQIILNKLQDEQALITNRYEHFICRSAQGTQFFVYQ